MDYSRFSTASLGQILAAKQADVIRGGSPESLANALRVRDGIAAELEARYDALRAEQDNTPEHTARAVRQADRLAELSRLLRLAAA